MAELYQFKPLAGNSVTKSLIVGEAKNATITAMAIPIRELLGDMKLAIMYNHYEEQGDSLRQVDVGWM